VPETLLAARHPVRVPPLVPELPHHGRGGGGQLVAEAERVRLVHHVAGRLVLVFLLEEGERNPKLEQLGLVALELAIGRVVRERLAVVVGKRGADLPPRHRLPGVEQQGYQVEQALGAFHESKRKMDSRSGRVKRHARV